MGKHDPAAGPTDPQNGDDARAPEPASEPHPQTQPIRRPENSDDPNRTEALGTVGGASAGRTEPISHQKDQPTTAPTAAFSRPVPAPRPASNSRPEDTRGDRGIEFHNGARPLTREAAVARGRDEYGGVKIGSAFFGWLTATGASVLLTALTAGVVAALGLATNVSVAQMANNAAADQSIGLSGAIVLLAILLVSYYCGGYVAGRMARFNGVRQGFAVWVWAVFFAVVLGVLGMVVGNQYDLLTNINTFSQLTFFQENLLVGIVSVLIVAAVTVGGALLGGLAGMHFHKQVDRVIFED